MTNQCRYPDAFVGDGREKIDPLIQLPGTVPMSLTRAQCRQMVDRFVTSKLSHHSGLGGTLWVILWYCQARRCPYVLMAIPAVGYQIKMGDNV